MQSVRWQIRRQPPFEVIAPAVHRLPVVLNSPHGGLLPGRFSGRLAARRAGDPPLGGYLGRRALPARPPARLPAAQGELPARLARREPRALRTRPEDVRGQPADLRQHPLGAGRRRPRHHRPHRLGERGDLHRAARRGGGAGAHRCRLQALPPHAQAARPRHARRVRPGGADRLPFDAVERARGSRPLAAGHRSRRSLRHQLRDRTHRLPRQILSRFGYSVSRNKPYAGGFITEHYGQPARGLHAMQIEINRSSTWTSGPSRRPGFDALAPISPASSAP
jgi:hypothetical protein